MSNSLPPILAHLLIELPPVTLEALADTDLWIEDELCSVVAVPSEDRASLLAALGQAPLLATIDDGDEFTVIIAETYVDNIPPLLGFTYQAEHRYRFVRLEATLPWDVVGYGAAIFTALTAAGISAGFYSGYSIDYLLISDDELTRAVGALEQLFIESRRLSQSRIQ